MCLMSGLCCDDFRHACLGEATNPPALTTTTKIAIATTEPEECQEQPLGSCLNLPCCEGLVCGLGDNLQPACLANDPALGQCFSDGARCTSDYQCCGFKCDTGKGRFACGDAIIVTEALSTTKTTATITTISTTTTKTPATGTTTTTANTIVLIAAVATTDECLAKPRSLCGDGGGICCSNLVCIPVGNKNTLRCEVPSPDEGTCYDADSKCSRNDHCCSGDCNLRAFKCRAPVTTTTTTTPAPTTEGNCQAEVFGSCLDTGCCSGMVCGVGMDGQPACLVNDPPFGECYDYTQPCSQFYQCCSFQCDTSTYTCKAQSGQLMADGDDDSLRLGGLPLLDSAAAAASEATAGNGDTNVNAGSTEYLAIGMASCALLALVVGIAAVSSRKTKRSKNAIAMLNRKFGARDKITYSFDDDAANGLTYDDFELRAQMLAGNGVGSTTSTVSSTSSTGHFYDTKIPLYDLAKPSGKEFGSATTNRIGSPGVDYRQQLGGGGSSVSLTSSSGTLSPFSPDRIAYL